MRLRWTNTSQIQTDEGGKGGLWGGSDRCVLSVRCNSRTLCGHVVRYEVVKSS